MFLGLHTQKQYTRGHGFEREQGERFWRDGMKGRNDVFIMQCQKVKEVIVFKITYSSKQVRPINPLWNSFIQIPDYWMLWIALLLLLIQSFLLLQKCNSLITNIKGF